VVRVSLRERTPVNTPPRRTLAWIRGATAPADIFAAELDGRLFFNVAGVGLDAQVAHRFAQRTTRRRGFLRYVAMTASEMARYRADQYTIVVGDETLRVRPLLIAIANGRQYGNGALIAPSARLDDGRLDLVVVSARSPLAALGAAAKGFELPREQRALVADAVNRIQGIADDLLECYRAPGAPSGPKVGVHALAGLIGQVVSEKRLQHKDKPEIGIEFKEVQAGVRAAVDPKEFQRSLSNLLNNSLEAFDGAGAVSVELSAPGEKVLIEVKDNGKGIKPEVLARLGQKGETHGKAGGTGLGLYHARSAVEAWGGSLKIESAPGKGTTVRIELPRAAARANSRTAILLDDDPLVHMNWKLAARAAGVNLKAYAAPEELAAGEKDLRKDTPIYIDSDLGANVKGEDTAKDLREKGFTDITMATGHGPEKFAHLPWLKVTGKEPPWA